MRRITRVVSIALLAGVAACRQPPARDPSPRGAERAAAPDAIADIARLLDSTRILAIGERHGWEEERRFLLAVVGDARVADRVHDVLVECGSSKYQDVADRYVAGTAVSRAELQRIWRSTSAVTLAPPSICGDVFDVVRRLNARPGRPRAIRVLLGQPPIDWYEVTAATRLDTFPRPDEFIARLVRGDVLRRSRKALLVVGSGHLFRDPRAPRPTLVQQLDAAAPGGVLTVIPFDGFGNTDSAAVLEQALAGLPVPSMIRLDASPLGAIDASTLFSDRVQRLLNGAIVEERVPRHRGSRLRDLFDALLYVGPRSSMTRTVDTPEQLADTAFVRELDRRSRLQFGQPFRPTRAADRRFFP